MPRVILDANTVRCQASPGPIVIDAGDRDDTVSVPSQRFNETYVRGGEGADALTGSGSLSGGPGNDVLTGGNDYPEPKGDSGLPSVLAGGPGDDLLRGVGAVNLSGDGDGWTSLDGSTPAGPDRGGGNDTMIGGNGDAIVSYAGRSAGVRVDLADPEGAQGAAGERDRLSAIDDVVGGAGDDVLLSDDARNKLGGGGGDDRLVGRGRGDRLAGGGSTTIASGAAVLVDRDTGTIVLRRPRSARKGELVDVTVAGAISVASLLPIDRSPARTTPFSARWRVRL